MKKIFKYSLVLLAGLSVALSCSKIDEKETNEPNKEDVTPVVGKQVTIKATLPDASTRVDFNLDETGSNPKLVLTWNADDILVVSSGSNAVEFTDPTIEDDGKTASFSGTLPEGGEPYTVSVKHADDALAAEQTQAADGDLGHIAYVAMQEGVTEADFADLHFTQTSGVLSLIAKLPADVSAAVKAVVFEAFDESATFFNGGNTLTINLTAPGAGTDNLLYVYANVLAGSIPANTEMFIRFVVNDGYYTRYQKFASSVSLTDGALNGLKLNCSHVDRWAGLGNDGSQANPYLIADKFQLQAVNGLLADETRYFKLIDDIDMDGFSWSHLNADSPYKPFDFDGNNKTITKLGGTLFYVINGSVKDLTLDQSNIAERGALAEYIQASGNTVTNVTVSNGTVNSSKSNVGGLIGCINKGTSADAITATITGCTVSNTDVTGAGVVGGLVGFADAKVSVSGCSYSDGTVTSSARYAGGMFGSTGNYESEISSCEVNNAVVSSEADRIGGFVGLEQTNVAISDCTVTDTDVTGALVNSDVGGFAGVSYGPINNCHVKGTGTVSSTFDNAGSLINVGGFTGYHSGSIVGCTAEATVNPKPGRNVGGFAGYVLQNGSISKSSSSGTVTAQGHYAGAFIGCMNPGTVSKCFATGSITNTQQNTGGFIGWLGGPSTVSDCFATGDISVPNQRVGGFVGLAESSSNITIERCYAAGKTSGNFSVGGLIGRISGPTITVSNSAAWNSEVTSALHEYNTNWSSGTIVGTTHPNCHLSNNYRKPGMTTEMWWSPEDSYSHPDVDGTTHPLVIRNNEEPYTYTEATVTALGAPYQFPYHGKCETGKTLSQLASTTLGWSSDVWDFSGELPTLK